MPPGDFPDVARFRGILGSFDVSTFPKPDKQLAAIDAVLNDYLPNLVRAFQNPYN